MQQNNYFKAVFRRKNLITSFIFDSALKIASYPKLILEVFIRKNFGQRYFSMASVITAAIIIFLIPAIFEALNKPDNAYLYNQNRQSIRSHYLSWYIFIVVFLVFAVIRWREVRKNPSTLDFRRFSLYTGDILPFLYNLRVFGKPLSERNIEIFVEPALFIIPGVVLILLGQNLGYLIIVSAILYGLSYVGQYKKGDDFVLDKIDEIILNEEMENVFVNDIAPDKARGVRFYTDKPKAKSLRKKLADSFVEADEEKEEVTFAE